jgi:threonine aldolase
MGSRGAFEMKKRLDFLSDTVTLPTEEMRKAMATAEVGDDGRLLTDGRGEDPTVRQLEDFGAQKFGKERGLYVSSGTMGNLVSLLTHCERGEPVVLEPNSHVLKAEGAAFMKKMGSSNPFS